MFERRVFLSCRLGVTDSPYRAPTTEAREELQSLSARAGPLVSWWWLFPLDLSSLCNIVQHYVARTSECGPRSFAI